MEVEEHEGLETVSWRKWWRNRPTIINQICPLYPLLFCFVVVETVQNHCVKVEIVCSAVTEFHSILYSISKCFLVMVPQSLLIVCFLTLLGPVALDGRKKFRCKLYTGLSYIQPSNWTRSEKCYDRWKFRMQCVTGINSSQDLKCILCPAQSYKRVICPARAKDPSC